MSVQSFHLTTSGSNNLFRASTRLCISSKLPPCQRRSASATTITSQRKPDPSKLHQTLKLPDNRTLGFAQYGVLPSADAQKSPTRSLLYLHGLPCSRLEPLLCQPLCEKLNLHLICPDRPGLGLSTFQPGRRITDYPNDLLHLIRHLKLAPSQGGHGIYVMGGSGGGPYSLACGALLPPEAGLRGVGVLAGFGPYAEAPSTARRINMRTRFSWWAMSSLPFALGPAAMRALCRWRILPTAQDEDPAVFARLMEKFVKSLPEKDRKVFEKEGVLAATAEAVREAFRQGGEGYVKDTSLLVEPWGFRLEDVRGTGKGGNEGRVRFWVGKEDAHAPVEMSRYMAKRVPKSLLKEYEGETHLTLADTYEEEIFRDMLETETESQ